MKKKNRQSNAGDIRHAPAYPIAGQQLFQLLRAALTDTLGFQPGFPRLARMLGEDVGLTHYWFHALPQKHVVAFLTLLERLPEPKRREVINECCRELPMLDHPRLAHDPLAVSSMESLLLRTDGLTWVQDGTEFHRTFLLTAFGHSFPRIAGDRLTVGGMDIHEPRKWVPVETVVYLKEPLPPTKVKELIAATWPSISTSKATLLLLNGVWSAAPALRRQILELASRHHVIVSVSRMPEPKELAGLVKTPVHLVTVSPTREEENWIRVKIEAR